MSKRGLVLGGGGITGIAWETGLLMGLAEAGIDLTTADRVVGTSAGSIVGAQVTSGTPLEELYARQLQPPGSPVVDGAVPVASIGLGVMVQLAVALLRARGDIEAFGRLAGARAVKVAARGRTPSVAERYEQVAIRIDGLEWTERDLVITAVDVETGALVAFGPTGSRPEVSLEDAVNASCAVPCVYPPIPIDGRLYIDGGVRSGANADLIAGCNPVIALTPVDRGLGPQLSAREQLAGLRVRRLVIWPDDEAKAAIGKNVLDPASRPGSALAGHAQAAAWAERVAEVWG